ncbi:DUF2726 domain-containing protein [Pseudoalteromonas piscicida]|uniref:DUF2726 domain-containing protein n=1 Tax=Pseudoalteromonas piscicida TaxID=43662 RepID=A0ABM6NK08_PSEO7|nr:DUF2726 domain-containing protein [Pseudoalteromonas piscicida]ATD09208.1 hypothetical protein PPIS_a4608 [Pseudoalteromonas piscicida]ATD09210.1 hypothetical protein PPIS_a4610 [Pseudoalteromonas piscicida]WPU31167.1 DUF2726 domain-containing protein [Pseudoalteromonas piscicida]WPU31168.1 DUF2726 domain-containing protein [Pseudoalteromonas piscicida]
MEFALLAILALVVVASIVASKYTDVGGNPYPFNRKESVFTTVEASFLHLLERAVGDIYKIVSRIKLIDVIECKPGISPKARRAAVTKAKNKQLDYVLVDKETLKIVAAVDLVNNSNKNGHKAQKDWFVSGALESAGIPHIRMKIKSGYQSAEVRAAILFKLGQKVEMPKKTRNRTYKPAVLSPSQAKAQSTQLAEI